MDSYRRKNRILLLIVFAQFSCTSTWFAGNAVMPEMVSDGMVDMAALGYLTSAVQIGFIIGTLVYALLGLSDRFSPSRVFFYSALAGAIANGCIPFLSAGGAGLIVLRFFTGFFLAGIYPVGMKIASDYQEKGLGKVLGFLVGALVLGTAFPHFLRSIGSGLPWRYVFTGTSLFTILGGVLVLWLVPNGPYYRRTEKMNPHVLIRLFKNKQFRNASFGYFGHMWELYAFWTLVPAIFSFRSHSVSPALISHSLASFIVIASGGIACAWLGIYTKRFGSARLATLSLFVSAVCCFLSPWLNALPEVLFYSFMLIWGMSVVADSPQFSALVAFYAPAENRGTALTLVNSLGFFITVFSIQFLSDLYVVKGHKSVLILLAIGPVLGLTAMIRDFSSFRREET